MSIPARPLNDVAEQAISVLVKEIGLADTIRFLNQFTSGYGDYTEEREALFKDATLDDVLSAMKKAGGRDAGGPK